MKGQVKSIDGKPSRLRFTKLEKMVVAHFESGRAEELIDRGDPAAFVASVSYMTMLTGYQEFYSMFKCKELVPVVSCSNADIFALEYAIYCLTRCSAYIEQYTENIGKKDKHVILKKLAGIRDALSYFYVQYYSPDLIYDHFDSAFSYYISNAEGVLQNKLLYRLKQCAGMKDFSTTSEKDFGFSAGVALGAYVTGRDHGLLSRYMETIDRGTGMFMNIRFWFGYNDLDEG